MAIAKQIYDHDLDGSVDNKGIIKQIYDEEAIKNAINLFLFSLRGDFIGNPDTGGILYNYLSKPMDQVKKEELEKTLQITIEKEFFPNLTITSLKVKPNYKKRYWDITIKGASTTYQVGFTFSQKFKNITG